MKKFKLAHKVQRVTDQLIKHYRPEKVILFGSHAQGVASKDSDIDLFVVKNTQDPYHKRVKQAYEAIHNVHDEPVDIIVYTPQEVEQNSFPGTFANTILNQGHIIYEK